MFSLSVRAVERTGFPQAPAAVASRHVLMVKSARRAVANRAIIRGRLRTLSVVALGTAALSVLAGCAGNADNSLPESRYLLQPAAQSYPSQGGHVTLASWYGPGFNGRRTSSGDVFRQNDLTAASKNLPLGSYARVTNVDTGKSVTVLINDRGPFVPGRGIDLSRGAAERVGVAHAGVARVKVTPVDTAAFVEPTPVERSRGRLRVRRRTYHHFEHHYAVYYPLNRVVSNPVRALLDAFR